MHKYNDSVYTVNFVQDHTMCGLLSRHVKHPSHYFTIDLQAACTAAYAGLYGDDAVLSGTDVLHVTCIMSIVKYAYSVKVKLHRLYDWT